MKKLLLLGGSSYLYPIIEKAHELGIYTITCDYLPNNHAHKISDEYRNINIVDKDAVLYAAKELKIDGVMSYACDPGVVTAAYVAEKLGLNFQCSYEAAVILQDKGLFRKFLSENGFNTPHAKKYTNASDVFNDIDYFTWPVIVKPVDMAGSKGVTKVEKPENLKKALETALSLSLSNSCIVEDFLFFEGHHSSADAFSVDGKLQFVTYSDQLFDKNAANPYAPTNIIWPSTMAKAYQEELSSETQRLLDLLNMKTGMYNIETCIANSGKPYIMELSPRGGGCRIAEIQKIAYGVDLIENEIRSAVNMPLIPISPNECDGHYCELVVHSTSKKSGILKAIEISPEIKEKYLKAEYIYVKTGDEIKPFTGANMVLADLHLKFDTRERLDQITGDFSKWINLELE